MEDIKPIYLKELHKYTVDDFKSRLHGNAKDKEREINLLISHNLLKRVAGSNDEEASSDELNSPVQGNEKFLALKYVGLIITQHNIICAYPKYIMQETDTLSTHFQKVLNVIKRLNRRELKLTLSNDVSDSSKLPLLSIILEIIHQYMENGIYIKNEQIQELNGDGEINWERTIGETEALIIKKKPFYPNMYTEYNQWNENDYFHRLHQCIIAECYQYITSTEISKMLNIHGGMKFDKKLRDFGSRKVIIQKLKKELKNQFVTWKKIAIRLMIAYLNKAGEKQERHSIVYYGTNDLNITWEKACAVVLGNQMEMAISNIDVLDDNFKNAYNETLGSIIEKPIWLACGASSENAQKADTLIPDTVVIQKNKDNALQLVIYDAKYYNINLTSKKVSGQPGIESITKQYLYHLAYKDFMEKANIHDVENVFLFPTMGESKELGSVTLNFLEKACNLIPIKAIMLNTDTVWNLFLENKQVTLNNLLANTSDSTF